MTITINETFLYYWIFAIAFLIIYYYVTIKAGWNQLKQQVELYSTLTVIFNSLKETASFRLLLKRIFSPVTYIAVFLILCLIAPILFPYSLFRIIRSILGKTKLDKESLKEEIAIENSQKHAENFMKNEGVLFENESNKTDYIYEQILPETEEGCDNDSIINEEKCFEDSTIPKENISKEKIISGQLYNDPFAFIQYWTLYESETNRPFRVVNTQYEILKQEVSDINNQMFNRNSRIYKARIISESHVEVILD